MSLLILPHSISRANAEDNAQADGVHATAEEHATALQAGIERTEKWARSTLGGWEAGDRLVTVTMPGHERIIHLRRDDSVASGLKVQVHPIRPARPCPGCGKPIYGIGEIQTATAPWHLACWELDQAQQAMATWEGLRNLEFDREGLVKA